MKNESLETSPSGILLGQPRFSEDEIASALDVLRSGWIGPGEWTRRFEERFRLHVGAPHAVAVCSGTMALEMALSLFGIGPGDEVITTAMTFAATVNAIVRAGATPVLVDVENRAFTLDPERVERATSPRTKAVIPVHLGGAPADMDRLLQLKARFGWRLIQDCAHAIETCWDGLPMGSFPDASCYSFGASKNLTTIEGGMLCLHDASIAEKARQFAQHGVSADAWERAGSDEFGHYDVHLAGHKARLSNFQSALGCAQLASVEERHRRRKQIHDRYQNAFRDAPLETPAPPAGRNTHAYHFYSVLIDPLRNSLDRDAWLGALRRRGIYCGVHYRSIPELSFYRSRFGWLPEDFPSALRRGRHTLSLPLSAHLSDAEVERVIETVLEVGREARP